MKTLISKAIGAFKQAAVELEEAAVLLRARQLPGVGSLYQAAAARSRNMAEELTMAELPIETFEDGRDVLLVSYSENKSEWTWLELMFRGSGETSVVKYVPEHAPAEKSIEMPISSSNTSQRMTALRSLFRDELRRAKAMTNDETFASAGVSLFEDCMIRAVKRMIGE